MAEFSHLDDQGRVRMVDVSEKAETDRRAVACGAVYMQAETLERIVGRDVKKGNVLETARIAGIMAAKQTAALIPLCHPLNPTHIGIDFQPDTAAGCIRIQAEVRVRQRTGVEMEALTAVCVAALTIYDMCKSYDRAMTLSEVGLLEKSGGKSGAFRRRP